MRYPTSVTKTAFPSYGKRKKLISHMADIYVSLQNFIPSDKTVLFTALFFRNQRERAIHVADEKDKMDFSSDLFQVHLY